MKEGIDDRDPIEIFSDNLFFVEREFGMVIDEDFPILKLLWYFDKLMEYYKNAKKA